MPQRIGSNGKRLRFAPGEPIVTVRLTLNFDNSREESEAFDYFSSGEEPLDMPGPPVGYFMDQVKQSISEELGDEFTVQRVIVGRGSVEVIFIIAAALEIIANWDDVIRNIGRLLSRLRGLLPSRRFMHFRPTWVGGSWQPEFDVESILAPPGRPIEQATLIIWYLIVTNLLMLSVFIWLLARRL